MTTSIWWIRRDLRLLDNQALSAAMECSQQVIPVFVIDPALLHSGYAGPRRISFLLRGLQSLNDALRSRGSYLIIREGKPRPQLEQLANEVGASAIFAEEDYSTYARRRDSLVASSLPLYLTPGISIQPPGSVMTGKAEPYSVYGPFARRWKQRLDECPVEPVAAPARIQTPPDLAGADLARFPGHRGESEFVAAEEEAWRRFERFVNKRAANYAARGDRLDEENSAQLSPYLRFGMISPRLLVSRLQRAIAAASNEQRGGLERWLNELIWRDYFIHILAHFPEVRGQSFQKKYQALQWPGDSRHFRAWTMGQTGYPIVDAAMRQLSCSGWMPNRARMIVASFLVKDLLVDWRQGERWFMQQLIDGDPALNNGNWQWVAGTGAGAAPYFRVFNPLTQSAKYDPQGRYVRRWIPELREVPSRFIHSPWKMSMQQQRNSTCIIGRDYPAPIVDHQEARREALALYKSALER